MQITRNNFHNKYSPISNHHLRNQDQENYPRHPRALHALRLLIHLLILLLLSSVFFLPNLPILQHKPLLSLCIRCSTRLRQSGCCMICTNAILRCSHIFQCCISFPKLYPHSESNHTGMVDVGETKQYQELGSHPTSSNRTE